MSSDMNFVVIFGPSLKSTTTHVVKLKPVNPEDIQG